MTFHGYVRATEDSDIVFLRTPNSELALLSALIDIDTKWIGDEIDPGTGIEMIYPVTLAYIQASHLMMLVTKFGFLDIFDFIPGHPSIGVEALFRTAEMYRGTYFSSLKWIRKMKIASGRPKDLIDLQNLPTQHDEPSN